MEFNDKFFEEIGKSAGVTQMCKEVAEKVLAAAQTSAPVNEVAYRDGLHVEVKTVENATSPSSWAATRRRR
ncbi:hypothetical protein [Arthrobacter sp. EpRS71]|uniref:hypothetical protein n=1 Tax=Arthrobacter sp. EpRS71 TaxID=1743141 RepID=UPI000AF5590E|nr:hypothetical protein [Arthrobacter sp. EpRS71]